MRWARSPLPWLGALLALYLLAPIVAFVVRLRGGVAGATGVGSALATSLVTATISAAVIAVLGIPLAYVLARARGAGGRLLTALVSLPLALPPLMSGLLLLYVIGPRTPVGELFGGKLTETRLGIVLAQTFVAAPFLVISARAAFTALDPALEEMAAAFGHGRLGRFARVAVPGALPGIVAGLTLSWLRAFGEFGATVIVAYHPFSLPVYTFVQFDASGLPATALPIALALAAALAVLLALGLPLPRARRRAPKLPPSLAPLPGAAAPLRFALQKRVGSFSLDVASDAGSARLAVLGASGAGKTLTLRMLSGLTAGEPGGTVELNGRALEQLPAERRPFGYVPQGSALLPRRSVWQQVTFGVRAQPPLAAWWLERLGLAGLEGRYPEQLSGGQRRRVALARALATAPAMLLLDEPFTGLDAPVRQQLRRELRRLQREDSLSSVIVTHDPEEAALLADEVIVLDAGRVLQAGPRERVFRAPRSPRVAALMGIANTWPGVVRARGLIASEGVELSACTGALPPGSAVVWCVRPERLRLDPAGAYEALLLDDADLGSSRELTVALGGELELTLRTDERAPLEPGTLLRLALAREDVSVWSGADAQPPM
ncbi:MAG TPA: ATP-binding cassette domain-containing protein [Solirubrobacteraceae bacterium]|nr:ATP-binding cassette domain-containing protein [Solirubrobacteraceae bacterium]